MRYKVFKALQLFAAEAGTITTTDVAPVISIDFTSRISQNIRELQELLGVIDLEPMAAGTEIKIYKWEVSELAEQVGEGEKIGLTKVKRALRQDLHYWRILQFGSRMLDHSQRVF